MLVFQGKTPEFTKNVKFFELFVSAPFLVWFAGVTPEKKKRKQEKKKENERGKERGRSKRGGKRGTRDGHEAPERLLGPGVAAAGFFEALLLQG